MTDKELLELAAKAHGGLVYIPDVDGWIHEDAQGNRGSWWHPLTDDGDALRLAVMLQISVLMNIVNIGAQATDLTLAGVFINEDSIYQDAYAATRRAIVRSAAEIGRVSQ